MMMLMSGDGAKINQGIDLKRWLQIVNLKSVVSSKGFTHLQRSNNLENNL